MRAGDPEHTEVDALQTMLVMLENPHMVWGYSEGELPDAERAAIKQTVMDRLTEMLAFNDLPYGDWIRSVESQALQG
jgi:hypothetical protein